ETIQLLILSRNQRLDKLPLSVAKSPQFRIRVLVEVFDFALRLEQRAHHSTGFNQIERCRQDVTVACGKFHGERGHVLFKIADKQERADVLFIKKVAMREVTGVQLSETFSVIADHEDQRIVEPGFAQVVDQVSQDRISEM